jgi:hypothetical protein
MISRITITAIPHAGEGNGAALLKPHHLIDLSQLTTIHLCRPAREPPE